MFRNEPLAAEAKAVSEIALDVSEVLMKLDLPKGATQEMKVAYHAACSLQHGQQIKTYPKDLLKRAGVHGDGTQGQSSVLWKCWHL